MMLGFSPSVQKCWDFLRLGFSPLGFSPGFVIGLREGDGVRDGEKCSNWASCQVAAHCSIFSLFYRTYFFMYAHRRHLLTMYKNWDLNWRACSTMQFVGNMFSINKEKR